MSAVATAPFTKQHMVEGLVKALTSGITNQPEWVDLREIRLRMANAQISLRDDALRSWLVDLVQVGKAERREQDGTEQYRLALGQGAETVPTVVVPPKRLTIPPRTEWPEWARTYLQRIADERDRVVNENIELKKQMAKLEDKVSEQERSLVITQYGDKKDLEVVKERVALVPYAANLNERGRAMVAQICYLLDWNPFFDMHAFESKGRLVLMPDYKKLMSMAKEQQRINHHSRPMTAKERQEVGLKDYQVGYVTEVKEIDVLLEFAQAGIADQYDPIIGYGIYSHAHKQDTKDIPADNVPNTWTPEMVAKKRSIRNALYQLTNYKIVTKRFREALMQIGAVSVAEGDDGFTVDMPEQVGAGVTDEPVPTLSGYWWGDPKQRQAFWKAAKAISSHKSKIAQALNFEIDGDPDNSDNWKEHMAAFPDLENAIAYVNAVAESSAPDVPVIDPEDHTPEPPAESSPEEAESGQESETPAKCANCEIDDADPDNPVDPTLCKTCAGKKADADAKTEKATAKKAAQVPA